MIRWGAYTLSLGAGGGWIASGHLLTIQVRPCWTSFGRIVITTSSTAKLPGGPDASTPPDLLCTECGNADDLIVEGIGGTVPAVPGHVFVEYLSPLKANRIKNKLIKRQRELERDAEMEAPRRRIAVAARA